MNELVSESLSVNYKIYFNVRTNQNFTIEALLRCNRCVNKPVVNVLTNKPKRWLDGHI